MSDVNVAVVGAGPAGLAAAVTAAEGGLTVALIDLGEQTGGQFWRHPDERHLDSFDQPESTGHHHWNEYVDLRGRLHTQVAAGRIRHLAGRQVWQVIDRSEAGRPRFALHTTAAHGLDRTPSEERVVAADRVVIATGAYDRQLPVPGWTLPGVMAAGGVQGMLKANQVLAGKRVVVAGTGPFLLSVAAGLARAGATVAAVCEANSPTLWARHPLKAMLQPGKALEGIEYAGTFLRHRVPLHTKTIVTQVHGDTRAEAVTLARVDGKGAVIAGTQRRVEADLVAFGWGFTPQLELAITLDLATRVDVDESLVVTVDPLQRTSLAGVYAAGESTGVTGAVQAVTEGRLAGLTVIADALGTPIPREAGRLQSRIRRGTSFAQAMHLASPVPERWADWLTPDTLVCRCEEVSCHTLSEGVGSLDTDDPRDVRVTLRPGMGWCQGRVCGFAVARLTGEQTGTTWTPADLAALSRRPIAAPLRLGDLAAVDSASASAES